jgi:xanthine dehydrogenase accessory factor
MENWENRTEPLLPLFHAARAKSEALALATLIETAGATYRKAGTQMLIDREGRYAGLLSGGCLEGDLAARAVDVITTGQAVYARYDMRGPDDQLWGLGSGCEGAMRILLSYCGPNNAYAPLPWLEDSLEASVADRYALVVTGPTASLGRCIRSDAVDTASNDATLLWIPLTPPPALLLCGGGPDAVPVAQLARFLGWRVDVVDHRAAYLEPGRFAIGVRVHEGRPTRFNTFLQRAHPDALVIMSHHLDTDRGWLAVAADEPPGYVGLLGPAPRREKLLAELTARQRLALAPVLRAPVGLDLGGRSPESIALAIISEIQAALHRRAGRPFSQVLG